MIFPMFFQLLENVAITKQPTNALPILLVSVIVILLVIGINLFFIKEDKKQKRED